MKIIAVSNIKGGVGKTTTAVNLAYLCAASGQRTLLWDLDPQGGASYLLGIDSGAHEVATAKRLLAGKYEVPELIVETGYANLDLLPANLSYRKFDIHLAARKKPTERLLKISRSLREAYDVLFLDCPPGISLLSENVLHAADVVMVPLPPTPLSLRMLVQLRDFIDDQGWQDLLLLPFFSMVDVRRSLHRELIASTREQFPAILDTEVPYWSEIERMSVRRAPVPVCSSAGAATTLYVALWREMSERMKRRSPHA
jgi:chromosome partitioning protein